MFQVHLQTILQAKDSNTIFAKINDWLQNLKNADQVISLLSEVQHTWLHLKSIFSENEDIKEQFPKHAILFDAIDASFKVMTFK